ncbi:hypothetical protein O6H91_10G029500 [Diphasiastrum complanatum]|uniref:Uncharacterized protein n=2 Tax=Diphasiastrum complanatum TaxID=34168 RepID=A0ACC2CFM7_DIPCM|nr:hypothetical protein O6H91_10G029500 [Diphasiastrum complanatum]KAJ7540761.1 hypothetical protein O6H91_10G029500 [Diphasiastrum complanatum]
MGKLALKHLINERMCLLASALLASLLLGSRAPCSVATSYYPPGGFVQIRGTQFFVDGHPLYVNGFNAYWMMYFAADAQSRAQVSALMDQASKLGLNVGRTWAFNDGSYRALQISPGVFSEQVFQGLDFVIAEAKNQGVRLLLSFANNYANFGGKPQYVQWGRNAGLHLENEDAFFSDSTVKGYYKTFVQTLLTRVNTITGVAYRDEPAIFGWELLNEARCTSDPSGSILQAWIEEMSAFVKSIDGNHILEVGLEGFYSPLSAERVSVNPSSFGEQTGTDFIKNNLPQQVDFATVHTYPDIWLSQENQDVQQEFTTNWIKSHIEDATYKLGKPVLFAEFGKSAYTAGYFQEQRDQLLSNIYATIYASASNGGAGAGALVWQLFTDGIESSFYDGYQIVLSQNPSTENIIAAQSHRMSYLSHL